MSSGLIEAIYVCQAHSGEPISVPAVEVKAGRGIVGDRHYQGEGDASPRHAPDRELTLIERETFDALARDLNLVVEPSTIRRNILTRGVALNHLVGVEFRVGSIRARGVELCEPCGHLAKLTSAELRRALVHRGGLRAEILDDGLIQVGDRVEVSPQVEAGRPGGRA